MGESLIVRAIHRYHPDWTPPKDTGRAWTPCRCPFHGDEVASAAVSYAHEAYNCLGCGVKGSPVHIIKLQEGVSYSTAIRIAEELSQGGSGELPPKPRRISRRGLLDDAGPSVPVADTRGQSPLPARVRRRTF